MIKLPAGYEMQEAFLERVHSKDPDALFFLLSEALAQLPAAQMQLAMRRIEQLEENVGGMLLFGIHPTSGNLLVRWLVGDEAACRAQAEEIAGGRMLLTEHLQ